MANFGLCVSPTLTQNEDIWNLREKMKEKLACFGLCVSLVLTQNEDIWNFHGLLTLNKKKLI